MCAFEMVVWFNLQLVVGARALPAREHRHLVQLHETDQIMHRHVLQLFAVRRAHY